MSKCPYCGEVNEDDREVFYHPCPLAPKPNPEDIPPPKQIPPEAEPPITAQALREPVKLKGCGCGGGGGKNPSLDRARVEAVRRAMSR